MSLVGLKKLYLRNASKDLIPERASFFSPKASSSSPRSANPFIGTLVSSLTQRIFRQSQRYANAIGVSRRARRANYKGQLLDVSYDLRRSRVISPTTAPQADHHLFGIYDVPSIPSTAHCVITIQDDNWRINLELSNATYVDIVRINKYRKYLGLPVISNRSGLIVIYPADHGDASFAKRVEWQQRSPDRSIMPCTHR